MAYEIGNSIYLRAPTKEDVLGDWSTWFNDPNVTKYLADRWWTNTQDDQLEFFSSLSNNRTRLVLSVCDIKTNQHIGVAGLSSINWVHRYADISLIIGNKEFRNGIASSEAMALTLKVAFNKLNLLNIRSTYMEGNPFTPLLEKLFKFKYQGRFEKIFFLDGEYVDAHISLLKQSDWFLRQK